MSSAHPQDSARVFAADGTELLAREVEWALARRWRDHRDYEARNKIILAYKKLVLKMSSKHAHSGVRLEDLVAVGQLGMLKAIDRFDPERGYGFGTLATHYIRQSHTEFLLDTTGQTRMFNTATEKNLNANLPRLKREWEYKNGRPFDDEGRADICKSLDITMDRLRNFEMVKAIPISIDPLAAPDEEGGRSQQFADPSPSVETSVLGSIANRRMMALIEEALAKLSRRDAEIWRARYPMGENQITLDALSKKYSVSRERVRQLQIRANDRVIEHLRAHGISGSSDILL